MGSDKSKMSRRELRNFGLVFAVLISAVFGVLLPHLADRAVPVWPWALALSLAIMAMLCPIVLRPIYVLWMKFGAVAGWINTRIILLLVFIVLITPVAILFKLIGKDPLQRTLNPNAETYRELREEQGKGHMENPY